MRLLITSLAEAKLCTCDLELSLPLRSRIEEELQIARNERGKAPSLSFIGEFSPKFIFPQGRRASRSFKRTSGALFVTACDATTRV